MVPELDQEYPGYASYVTPDARAMRDSLGPHLRLKLIEISEMLAMDPRGFASRVKKLPVGKEVYVYEHPDPSVQVTYQLDEGKEPKLIRFVHFAALKMELKRTLFISYSHHDRDFLVELKRFLKGLEDQEIALWDDQQIAVGDRWRDEICKALIAAKAALLLVSQDFLASDFIAKDELPLLLQQAEKHGLKIFWIPVKPSTFMHTPIAAFQAAVDDPTISMSTLRKAKREEQYVRIYEKLAKAMAS